MALPIPKSRKTCHRGCTAISRTTCLIDREPVVSLGSGQLDRHSGLLATRLDGAVSGLAVRDQMVALLRADDQIGVRELLRAERNGFDRDVMRLMQNAGDQLDRDASPEALRPARGCLANWSIVASARWCR